MFQDGPGYGGEGALVMRAATKGSLESFPAANQAPGDHYEFNSRLGSGQRRCHRSNR